MSNFQLKVRRFNQTCEFELSWGNGQRLSTTLAYPESLTAFYQEWQRVYLSYYRSGLRGWIEDSGSISTPPIDWHAKLVQAEAQLLSEFHHWLRSAELFEIRATIAKSQWLGVVGTSLTEISACPPITSIDPPIQKSGRFESSRDKVDTQPSTINVFITCSSIELERLPWEAWEIGAEFPTFGTIRIARTPSNSRQEPISIRRKKARILAIFGDETGLNFQGDREAVRSLSRVADIEFVGWQPGVEIPELKAQISAAIADERGWSVLLFVGHSHEMAMTGGEFAIAPDASMSICEIAPQLQLAKERGLQFALFNSCSGLNIAASLIDLGLSQVAIMREPIHNAVAQVFLLRFLQELGNYKDVHDCLLAACQHLKLEKNLTYPSAHLIPSLFCHPDSELFRIEPFGLKKSIKQILPTKKEAIAISAFILLSLSLPVQDWLLEKRLLAQAVYRQLTGQITTAAPPPVLLVQIDEKSIQKANIADPRPMNRKYLASLVDKLSAMDARVVGIDYVLDRPETKDNSNSIPPEQILSRSLQAAVVRQPHSTWFVLASARDYTAGWLTVLPEIASPNWSLQGHIHLSRWYVGLVSQENFTSQKLPFAYLLALAYQLHGEANDINPQLSSQIDFFSRIARYLSQEKGQDYRTIFSPLAQLQPITSFSYNWHQMWLHPIIDFSIPPEQVYQRIPAWQLLESPDDSPLLRHIQQQVVTIAPGGYGEAGVFEEGQDNFPIPPAVAYWFDRANPPLPHYRFTGGEAHAYTIHHYLNRRLVIPIPDLWSIGVAVLLGKGMTLLLGKKAIASQKLRRITWGMLLGGTAVYGLVSLQVYVSGALLLPWVFPSVTFWTYALSVFLRKKRDLVQEKTRWS